MLVPTYIFRLERRVFVLGSIFVLCSQSGNDPQEYLARFGYKLNMNVKIFEKILLIFLVTYVNHVYSNIESGEESHFFGSILCYLAKVAMIHKNI